MASFNKTAELYIEQGKNIEAINAMLNFLKDNNIEDLKNELTLLKSQINRAISEKLVGVLSVQDFNIQQNKITASLLIFLGEFKDLEDRYLRANEGERDVLIEQFFSTHAYFLATKNAAGYLNTFHPDMLIHQEKVEDIQALLNELNDVDYIFSSVRLIHKYDDFVVAVVVQHTRKRVPDNIFRPNSITNYYWLRLYQNEWKIYHQIPKKVEYLDDPVTLFNALMNRNQ